MCRTTGLYPIILVFISAVAVAKGDQSLLRELTPVAKQLISTFKSGNVTDHLKLGINKDEARKLLKLNYEYATRNAKNNSKAYNSRYKSRSSNIGSLMNKRNTDRKLYFNRAVNSINDIVSTSELNFKSIAIDKYSKRGKAKALYARLYFGSKNTILQVHVNYVKIGRAWKLNKARSYQVKRVSKR